MRRNNTPQIFITTFFLNELKETIKIGQKVRVNKVPYTTGQGRYAESSEPREGVIIAKYPNFFVVQLKGYKESFRYTDLLDGTVEITKEETDTFSWLKALRG